MSKLSLNKSTSSSRFFSRARLEGTGVFLFIIFLSIMALVAWAYHAEIDKVVRVTGKIIPAGHSRQIQHLEGGIVSAISTYEGAIVKKGDLLMTIEDANADADLNEIKVKLNGQRIREARLKAEASDKSTISFPTHLREKSLIGAERDLFYSRKNNIKESLLVHKELILQHKAALGENEVRSGRLAQELAIASKRSRMFEKMAKHNAASQVEVLDAQSRENRLKTEISNAIGAKPKLDAAIREEHAKIAKIKASHKSDIQNDLVATLTEIDRLTQIRRAAKDRKERTDIRSPMDGVINRIGYNTIGSVIKAGQSIIELTPHSNEILVEASANPNDRGELHAGIDAIVRVSAYDVSTLGALKGKVTEISADTVSDPKGSPYYRVKILIHSIPTAYQTHALMPGMLVTSDLVTGRRTIFNYLMSPLRKFTNNMFRDPR